VCYLKYGPLTRSQLKLRSFARKVVHTCVRQLIVGIYIYIKIKVKFTLEQATKAQRVVEV
jgi:hypothetical protein